MINPTLLILEPEEKNLTLSKAGSAVGHWKVCMVHLLYAGSWQTGNAVA